MEARNFTTHAKKRWAERCSHLDMDVELATVRRPSKSELRKMMKAGTISNGIDWHINNTVLVSDNLVLVLSADGSVITVFGKQSLRSKARARDAERRAESKSASRQSPYRGYKMRCE